MCLHNLYLIKVKLGVATELQYSANGLQSLFLCCTDLTQTLTHVYWSEHLSSACPPTMSWPLGRPDETQTEYTSNITNLWIYIQQTNIDENLICWEKVKEKA